MASEVATLVDSNVILDLVTDDPTWAPWSAVALSTSFDRGSVVINPIVYAEVSVRFDRIEALDVALPEPEFRREGLPYAAAFLAGKAFVDYRRRGGSKSAPLPDFLIGAHAAVRGYRLLTRDAAPYRTYFPSVQVDTPDGGA